MRTRNGQMGDLAMYSAEQIEKSGEHHDRMQATMQKIAMTFVMPIAFLLWIMLCALAVISMGVTADVTSALSAWAREASQHPVQPYAQAVFAYCWKAVLVLFTLCVATLLFFHIYVVWRWPRQ